MPRTASKALTRPRAGVVAGVLVGAAAGVVTGLLAGTAVELMAETIGPGTEPGDAGWAPA